MTICSLCSKIVKAKGLCKKHYDAQRRSDPIVLQKQKEVRAAYLLKNKEKHSKEYKEWYAGKGREYDRNRGLIFRYGIDIETYNKILKNQDFKCAICKVATPDDDNYHFQVDHCHKTNEIRGLLCGSCNKMLGLSKDSASSLRAGALYLERFPVPEVKQVIVIRRDYADKNGNKMQLRTGKIAAQASHASMMFLVRRLEYKEQLGINMDLKQAHVYYEPGFSDAENQWLEGAFTKVCLQVDSEKELLDLHALATSAGLQSHLIRDAGQTEFNGVPTYTCLALGPDYNERIDPITQHLKLY